MHRPRLAIGFLLAPILFTLAFFTYACGGGAPEQPLIQKFFNATKYRDNMTLGGIAVTSFDKNTDGTVDRFSVVSVSEEKVQALHLKELAAAHNAAKKDDDDFTAKKRAFQDQHSDELKALMDAEKKGVKPKGKAAEFATSWNKWVEDTKLSARKVSEAREKLSAERSIADISVFNPQTPIDATEYDGELATKDYTINADVTTPDGKHVKKTLVITLQQARLKGDKPITGRWIITKITEVPGGATS